ncbi:uncharacterized protein BDZ99DRAFT_484974 [Mytilinidion resinicola]|uniref:ABM domain-containing protein n=1 Tax=Mytilinidion resinicola TaxID=574789 RepID=A0A6A6Z5D7_9PEZI|nr:uncharacterized protein BDZ99DRAFT_484974 [Mytilinidion resinicola]KAF2816331.1 hypothetical protein BDZ99DRAFT_484974 [Mytilinidion resinicola]
MFYLFANCNFVPDNIVSQWQAAYDELAKYVWSSEPTTKTYYFGIPLDYAHDFHKTTSMFAFEVYGAREDLYETHLNSPSMQMFLSLIPAASTTGLDLSHYAARSGFLDLFGDSRECGIMQDTRIVCTSSSARSSVLAALTTLAEIVEKTEKAAGAEAGVYTARIFARFKGREEMEAFLRKKEVIGFWMAEKEGMKSMECRGYLPNGKGWLHR